MYLPRVCDRVTPFGIPVPDLRRTQGELNATLTPPAEECSLLRQAHPSYYATNPAPKTRMANFGSFMGWPQMGALGPPRTRRNARCGQCFTSR